MMNATRPRRKILADTQVYFILPVSFPQKLKTPEASNCQKLNSGNNTQCLCKDTVIEVSYIRYLIMAFNIFSVLQVFFSPISLVPCERLYDCLIKEDSNPHNVKKDLKSSLPDEE